MSDATQERPVSIKGSKDGLLLILSPQASFEEIRRDLQQQLKTGFFKGAASRVRIQATTLEPFELDIIKQMILEAGLTILDSAAESALSLRKALYEQEFQSSGDIEIVESDAKRAESATAPGDKQSDIAAEIIRPDAQIIQGPLRSGARVTSKLTLVIVGDVNPGAELVSERDIFVWGTLRGKAYAGCSGNKDAKIYALKIQAIQLAIADCITAGTDKNTSSGLTRGFEVARLIECEDGRQNILVDEVTR